jgi:predicted nucleic acid-binding protein
MRVLVDTSVWVDFFNRHPSREAELLTHLIEDEVDLVTCGVIVAEFFQGIRRTESLNELEAHFRDMAWLSPKEPETYLAAAALYRDLRAQGVTVRSTIDCLIAHLAEAHGALLLAKDRDLARILESDLTTVRGLP